MREHGIPILALLYKVTDYDIVVASATGCFEVATTIYPQYILAQTVRPQRVRKRGEA